MSQEAKYKTLAQITLGLNVSNWDVLTLENMIVKYEPGIDPPSIEKRVILPRFVTFNHGNWDDPGQMTEYDLLVPEQCRDFLMQFKS